MVDIVRGVTYLKLESQRRQHKIEQIFDDIMAENCQNLLSSINQQND